MNSSVGCIRSIVASAYARQALPTQFGKPLWVGTYRALSWMDPLFRKGKLTVWKNAQGFGFIQPDKEKKAVFLHISALKSASRRPEVGDTILYRLVTESGGKVRATSASILGDTLQPAVVRQKQVFKKQKQVFKAQRKTNGLLETLIGLFGAAITFTVIFAEFKPAVEFIRNRVSPLKVANVTQVCSIKGNISISSGNKLYHLPGMEDYATTNIEAIHGERWFCTEAEAISEGWRKAPK